MAEELNEERLQDLYAWVDKIPLSRSKKNISRDFSDGMLAAEVVKFYFPKLVEMHNYVPANAVEQKVINWMHLNRKVFKKLNFSIPYDLIQNISRCTPGIIEVVLNNLKEKIEVKQRENEQKMTFSSQETVDKVDNDTEEQKNGRSAPLKTRNTQVGNNPQSNQGNKHSSQRSSSLFSTNGAPIIPKEDNVHTMQEKEKFLVYQETIQILQAKIQRLEQLVQLKDKRIEELSRRIQQMEQNHIIK